MQILADLKLIAQSLQVMGSTIRKKPELFECANDYVVMNHLQHQVHSGAIEVMNAISWAHAQKYGYPEQPPLPPPLPEYDSCPHCHGSYSFTKLVGNNCPHCGKKVREPNAFAEMMRGKPKELSEIHADIDATE